MHKALGSSPNATIHACARAHTHANLHACTRTHTYTSQVLVSHTAKIITPVSREESLWTEGQH